MKFTSIGVFIAHTGHTAFQTLIQFFYIAHLILMCHIPYVFHNHILLLLILQHVLLILLLFEQLIVLRVGLLRRELARLQHSQGLGSWQLGVIVRSRLLVQHPLPQLRFTCLVNKVLLSIQVHF